MPFIKQILKDCKVYCKGVCIGIADVELPKPNIVKLWPIMLKEDIAEIIDKEKIITVIKDSKVRR